MATEDAVRSKLSGLNETQEGIVTVAQWVLFHRRQADRIVTIWLSRLKESSPNRRLNLIYLANEVAQQSKARRKDEYIIAFSPVIAEGTATAYRGAAADVQTKLRRVIEVWRQRQIFDAGIQDAVESRIEELDKSKGSGKRTLGGSLFSSSAGGGGSGGVPGELQALATAQIALNKANATTTSTVPNAEAEYTKLTDPDKPVPAPPVYAARLSALMKSLASAESAVSESLKARSSLLDGLVKLADEQRNKLAEDETQHKRLSERKSAIEAKKREVEDGIMRGLSAENSPTTPRGGGDPRLNGQTAVHGSGGSPEPDRPDVEELTPPPPDAQPPADASTSTPSIPTSTDPRPVSATHTPQPPTSTAVENGSYGANFSLPGTNVGYNQAGADLLSSLNVPGVRAYSGSPGGPAQGVKRRRVDDDAAAVFGTEGGDALSELDEDVAELLRQESGRG